MTNMEEMRTNLFSFLDFEQFHNLAAIIHIKHSTHTLAAVKARSNKAYEIEYRMTHEKQ